MTPPIRIVLVEDSALVRQGIISLLSAGVETPLLQVVAEAASNAEAIAICDQYRPDIVLLDIRLPDGPGFIACKEILQRLPGTRIIVLTSHSSDSFVYEAISAGAHGYLMKEIDPAGLIQAIRDVFAGKSVLAPDATERVLNFLRADTQSPDKGNELATLSSQESRVLSQVAEGLTNKQIGANLHLSENTVKNYLGRVFEKLQIKRRAQAAALYVQHQQAGSLPPPRPPKPPAARDGGFSLVEVMIASCVMVLAIVTAITALQHGFKAVDTARNYTYSSQLMQSELERLRLQSWSQIEALQNAGPAPVTTDDTASAARAMFTCQRVITDVKTDMKQITLISQWQGYDGRSHTARFITRYSKNGLYDYLYTAH